MPCRNFKLGDGTEFIICSRGQRAKPCHYCGKPSVALCDFPIKPRGKVKRTCDVAMCEACRNRGVTENVDFCRAHFPLAKAAWERRQKRNQTDEQRTS